MSEEIKTGVDEAAGAEPSAKKSKKKAGIIAGVVAAVIVVAGAGFWVWHEQPSFCNAICHTPMDPYLPTYEAEPGEAALDKWGNEVDDAGAMLAATHRVEAEADCMSCHVPTLSEQVTEGLAWATGGYEVVPNEVFGSALPEKSLADLTEARGVDGESFCLNEACHANDDGSAMTRDDLVALTADYEFNPHVDQHGNATCSDCHKAHRASVMLCTQCHGEAEVPDGWLTVVESKQLPAQA